MVIHASQISSSNYTVAQANSTIASTYRYINSVNESGYLIFEPNLTSAYNYISKASLLENTSPDVAVVYAQTAYSLAQSQYDAISAYRGRSLPVLVIFTIVALIALLKVMGPITVKKRKGVK